MANLTKARNAEDVIYIASSPINPEDEISLIDLWLILVRRKRVILVGLLIGVVASIVLLSVPEKYRFHTTIVLGQLNYTSQIDTPETVLAKLKEGYLPQILKRLMAEDKNAKAYKLQVDIPKKSNLVIVEAKGSLQDESTYLQLINDTAQALVQDHDKILAPAVAKLSTQLELAKLELGTTRDDHIFAVKLNTFKQKIANARLKLLALKDQRKIIESRYKYTEIEDGLAKTQHQEYESTLKTALKNRAESIKQSGNPATAVTLLMFGNEIQHYQNRIAELDQRMHIVLPEKRENLQKQLEDNTRAQQQQTEQISNYQAELEKMHIDRTKLESIQLLAIKQIESNIEGMRPTIVLGHASRSIRPVGIGTAVKIVLGIILGLMMGVFGAFFVEFLSKTRKISAQPR